MTPATSPLPPPSYQTVPVIVSVTFSAPKFWIGDFYLSAGGRSQPSVIRRDVARLGGVRARHFLPHTSTMHMQNKLCSVSFLIRLISMFLFRLAGKRERLS